MDANGKDINEAKKREEERVKSLEQAQTKLDALTKEFDEFKNQDDRGRKEKAIRIGRKTKYETALAEAEKIKKTILDLQGK